MTSDTQKTKNSNRSSQMIKKFRISLIVILISFSCGNIFIQGVSAHSHTNSDNFYELLEIKPNTSKADIKKAYRSLSKKYHPDKNQGDQDSAQHFAKIARAYEVLSDDNKRQMFDQQGIDGVERYENGQHQIQKGPNGRADVHVSLKEMYLGTTKKMNIKRNIYCEDCRGTGALGGKLTTCKKCKGQGVVMQNVNVGMGMQMQMQTHCPKCRGKGKWQAAKCKQCRGNRLINQKKIVDLDWEKGTSQGDTQVLSGEADQEPDMGRGDLVFTVKQKPHPTFKRVGNNLYFVMTLNLQESLLGFEKTLTHLDDRIITVKSDPNEIIQPDSWKIIKGEGMPIKGSDDQYGDLHVKMVVKFPKKLTDKQIQTLGAILPES